MYLFTKATHLATRLIILETILCVNLQITVATILHLSLHHPIYVHVLAIVLVAEAGKSFISLNQHFKKIP